MEDNILNQAPITEPISVDGKTLAQTDEIIPVAPDDTNMVQTNEPPQSITVAEFFGTIQESVSISWRMHLKTRSYSIHMALEGFYNKALDTIDNLIEQYQGINGVVDDTFVNIIAFETKSEVEYFTELKDFILKNKYILGDHSEINSTIDELLGVIDSTIYKMVNLHENVVKTFDEFCYEDLNNE